MYCGWCSGKNNQEEKCLFKVNDSWESRSADHILLFTEKI